jgi:outer membrane immunogenic protein
VWLLAPEKHILFVAKTQIFDDKNVVKTGTHKGVSELYEYSLMHEGTTMTKSIYISAAALLLATPSFAGGLSTPIVEQAPVVATVAPQVMPAWSGGYVGANVNFGKSSVDANGDFASALADLGYDKSLSEPDGVSGAVRGGYDWQMGRGVYGLGGEYNFGKYEDALTDGADVAGDVKIDNMATIFARAGYAVNDQFMAYGLVGYSWADMSTTVDGESVDLDGVTLGLGGEYKFTQNWSGYGEYTYTDFGDIEGSEGLVEADLQQVKLGLNYRF